MDSVAEKLKELIEKNGSDYLVEEPYMVYKELIRSKIADKKTAGALLMLMAVGLPKSIKSEGDKELLSKLIQKQCCFNKKMSDRLAEILLALYSDENKKEWADNALIGLKSFQKKPLEFEWNGNAVWDEGNGSIDCYYSAKIVLSPTAKVSENTELKKMLKKNPLTEEAVIREILIKQLKSYLDDEFEEYCTCDDYYPPVVEDFELDYYLEKWCKDNGFEVVSCDGDGSDGGYEPKFRRRW